MKAANEINKSVQIVIDYVKDVTGRTIMDAVSRGDVKLDRQTMTRLVHIVNLAIDKGHLEAARDFDKQVKASLERLESESQTKKK